MVEYTYDGDDLRTRKVVRSSKDGYAVKVTNYTYDRQYVILETDDSGKATVRYVHGINYITRIDVSNKLSYYLFNGHGDVMQTVSESGAVENQYDYDIFGNPTLTIEMYAASIRYAGVFYDAEVGLYYLRARYYDPYIGRFISEDTYQGKANDPLSLNLYTYVHNDPIMYVDPTGHAAANINVGGIQVGNAQVNNGISTGNLTDMAKGLGGSIDWNKNTKTTTLMVGGTTVTYDLNNIKNGKGTASDGSTFTVINGKIQVAVRDVTKVANNSGKDGSANETTWSSSSKAVNVTVKTAQQVAPPSSLTGSQNERIISVIADSMRNNPTPSGNSNCSCTSVPIQTNGNDGDKSASGSGKGTPVPEAYKTYIEDLKKAHPNWNFEFYNAPMTWDELIKGEDKDETNLIETSSPQSYRKSDPNNKDSWSPPTKQVIEYYADPRNFLTNDKDLFQFLYLKYDEKKETLIGVQSILNKTVFSGNSETIIEAAKKSKVSSYYLASKLVTEAGTHGNPLSNGTVKGYEGYYNPYNYKASGSTDSEVLKKGAAYAKGKEWNSLESGIVEGAIKLADDYIDKRQDTIYSQKFDIVPPDYYNHQYMQNIAVASLEGPKLYNVYKETNALDANLTFRIPVYSGMPTQAVSLPK